MKFKYGLVAFLIPILSLLLIFNFSSVLDSISDLVLIIFTIAAPLVCVAFTILSVRGREPRLVWALGATSTLTLIFVLLLLVYNAYEPEVESFQLCSGMGGDEGSQWKCEDRDSGCGYGWTEHPSRHCDLDLPRSERRVCCIPTG